MEEGVFPHSRSVNDPSELEEERRIAYVGITRAEKRLYVSRAISRGSWGAPQQNPPSRFLPEIPEELIEWRRTEADQMSWHSKSSSSRRAERRAARTAGGGAVPSLEPGDRVVHDTFGLGSVVTVRGVGDNAEATVDFGSEGVKRLLLRYAPVQKL